MPCRTSSSLVPMLFFALLFACGACGRADETVDPAAPDGPTHEGEHDPAVEGAAGQPEAAARARPDAPDRVEPPASAVGVRAGDPSKTTALIDSMEAAAAPLSSEQQELGMRLLTAVFKGESAGLQRVLSAGADPDYQAEPGGMSALMSAAGAGHVDGMRILLAAGADPNLQDRRGRTALMAAAHNPAVARMLLAGGADATLRDKTGSSALMEFTAVVGSGNKLPPGAGEFRDELLAAGADPKDVTACQLAPALAQAAGAGDSAEVARLLSIGARTGGCSQLDAPPLTAASARGHLDVAELLLQAGADPDQLSANGMCALSAALLNDQSETLALLLRSGANPNGALPGLPVTPPLVRAVVFEKVDAVRTLLRAGADPEGRGASDSGHWLSTGRTPLMIAAARGNAELVDVLLAGGASPSAKGPKGMTATDLAARSQRTEIVATLERAARR